MNETKCDKCGNKGIATHPSGKFYVAICNQCSAGVRVLLAETNELSDRLERLARLANPEAFQPSPPSPVAGEKEKPPGQVAYERWNGTKYHDWHKEAECNKFVWNAIAEAVIAAWKARQGTFDEWLLAENKRGRLEYVSTDHKRYCDMHYAYQAGQESAPKP